MQVKRQYVTLKEEGKTRSLHLSIYFFSFSCNDERLYA